MYNALVVLYLSLVSGRDRMWRPKAMAASSLSRALPLRRLARQQRISVKQLHTGKGRGRCRR